MTRLLIGVLLTLYLGGCLLGCAGHAVNVTFTAAIAPPSGVSIGVTVGVEGPEELKETER